MKTKEKVKPVNCSNDAQMVAEGYRKPLVQPKEISAKKPVELRQLYKKLAKQQPLQNKVMLRHSLNNPILPQL